MLAPPPRRLIFCYPVYVSSLYCDVHIPPVSVVSLILSVYIVMLLSAVLLPCFCWLSTLRCSTLHLSATVLFTLTACIVMLAPFCLRCSPVLTLNVHISPVSPCCSPVDDSCVHCDDYPPFLSINAVVIIGIPQFYIRVPFKTDFISFPHLPIHMLTLLIISTYEIFCFYIHTTSSPPWSIFLISTTFSCF